MDCKLEITLDPEWIEAVVNRLFELGARGVEVISEEPLGIVCTYSDSMESAGAYANKIRSYLKSLSRLWPKAVPFSLKIEPLERQDWAEAWKVYFKPIHVTPTLVVQPSWHEYTPNPAEIVMKIDPKMAFGTGTHETTMLALEAIDRIVKDEKSQEKSCLLDVGCGSGILSIAAVLQGFPIAIGIDIDPIAVDCAWENAGLNKVQSQCVFLNCELELIQGWFSVIVANIDADALIALSSEFLRMLMPGGTLVLTGIIDERKEDVRQSFQNLGFKLVRFHERGPWSLLELTLEEQ